MERKMNPNAVNQFPKGSTIFAQGESVFNIGMIIKGRVLILNEGARVIVGSGSYLGINDLYLGKYQSTYTALDDLLLFVYPINRTDELDIILSVNKDYHGFMVASFYKLIYELDQIYHAVLKCNTSLYQFVTDNYKKYLAIATRRGFKARLAERFEQLDQTDSDLELIADRIQYYIECKNLPIDAVKQFYSYGNAITMYQMEDEVTIVNQQIETLREMATKLSSMVECLIDDSETCLFRMIAELAISLNGSPGLADEVMDMMDDIVEQVNHAEILSDKMIGTNLKINRKKMEEIYHLLLTNNKNDTVSTETLLKYSREDTEKAMEEMKDSFAKLLEYAGISGEEADEMKDAMLDYVHLKDKFTIDDSVRGLRRKIADNHYKIYLPVFLRAYEEKNPPRIVDMFLKYGFADEKLLTNDQLLSLYFLKEAESTGMCNVYDIKAWLTMIYEGKKEPSKNEFDMEYPEMLANLRKENRLTEKEIQQWASNPTKKLEYEIQNMFRSNNRTTNGQITSFVPVLHKDQWSTNIEKLYVTAAKISEAMEGILRIDYSVFDREVIYSNKEKNIVKEYVIKRILPDVILMPTVGINGIMWQEITGKRRDSAARFLLPILTDISLSLLLIRTFGRFRWELCRTVEGASWNDIQRKSLTSEYSDYLQFYRKNKDLTEEKKEKLKHQIQKGRSNNREVFVLDYEQWINFEATGAFKLNKPVREIMATYCPFTKEIRERLKLQPMFEEAMTRYNKEKVRKVREIEGRCRLLQKESIEIPQELTETLIYYRDK